jgi:hypothetical protein
MPPRWGGRIRYFGHACLALQTVHAAIVTDPFISADSAAPGRFTYRDLPDYIDLVLITHGHQDHMVLETLLQLRGRVGAVVVPRSSRGKASAIMAELGSDEAYVYAMGEESWASTSGAGSRYLDRGGFRWPADVRSAPPAAFGDTIRSGYNPLTAAELCVQSGSMGDASAVLLRQ